LLRNRGNDATAVSPVSSEKEPLILDGDTREFEGQEEEDDSNSLGTYEIDKRLLIKANHLDEYFKPIARASLYSRS
jgi:hypothetical protein